MCSDGYDYFQHCNKIKLKKGSSIKNSNTYVSYFQSPKLAIKVNITENYF